MITNYFIFILLVISNWLRTCINKVIPNVLIMISQQQGLKQQVKISPQQIQLLNFFAYTSLEIEHMIKTELEDNPFLDTQTESEVDVDDMREQDMDGDTGEDLEYDPYQSKSSGKDNEYSFSKPLVTQVNFREDAKQQLRILVMEDDTRELAEYIIDTLTDRGLLERSLEEIAEDLSFQKKIWVDVADLEKAIAVLQYIEPIGLGARDIRECLLMQLKQKEDCEMARLAFEVIDKYYDDIIHHKFEKICHDLKVENKRLKEILHYVGRLNFYPVSGQAATATEQKNTIIPDFMITANGGRISVNLVSSKSDSITINQALYNEMKDLSKERSARTYVSNKIQSAKWFMDAVRQREETMLKVMQCIVEYQAEYFAEGDIEKLKPMVLKDVAAISGYDISTLSRITSSRYADTHFGVIYLKDLFSEGLADKKGASISNKVIQSVIKETITAEDKEHPYTDQVITTLLQKQGYNIARRTVTKYRELIGIPTAQIRAMQFAIK